MSQMNSAVSPDAAAFLQLIGQERGQRRDFAASTGNAALAANVERERIAAQQAEGGRDRAAQLLALEAQNRAAAEQARLDREAQAGLQSERLGAEQSMLDQQLKSQEAVAQRQLQLEARGQKLMEINAKAERAVQLAGMAQEIALARGQTEAAQRLEELKARVAYTAARTQAELQIKSGMLGEAQLQTEATRSQIAKTLEDKVAADTGRYNSLTGQFESMGLRLTANILDNSETRGGLENVRDALHDGLGAFIGVPSFDPNVTPENSMWGMWAERSDPSPTALRDRALMAKLVVDSFAGSAAGLGPEVQVALQGIFEATKPDEIGVKVREAAAMGVDGATLAAFATYLQQLPTYFSTKEFGGTMNPAENKAIRQRLQAVGAGYRQIGQEIQRQSGGLPADNARELLAVLGALDSPAAGGAVQRLMDRGLLSPAQGANLLAQAEGYRAGRTNLKSLQSELQQLSLQSVERNEGALLGQVGQTSDPVAQALAGASEALREVTAEIEGYSVE